MCVQRFDDSLNSAIHITYRISLRSSSMPEPRDPLLKVVFITCFADADSTDKKEFNWVQSAGEPTKETSSAKDMGGASAAKGRARRSNKGKVYKGLGHGPEGAQ
jgi:hypothetical protein